jgi:hypothetical protein
MKKIIVFFLTLTLVCGFVAAQEEEEKEGIGLEAGVEFGFGNVADEAVLGVTPQLIYENSFDALDVFAELDYSFTFEEEDLVQGLYAEEELGYNLSLGETSTLSFIVNNQNTILVAPELPDGFNSVLGVVEPSVKFTQAFDFGDLSAQVGFPIEYLLEVEDESALSVYLTLAYATDFGLGIELTPITYNIDPDQEVSGYGLLVSYEQDLFYGEVEVTTDKDFKVFVITPTVEVYLNDFTFWVTADFENVGDPDNDVAITPAIGVKYSF